jgi:hypothetical protein
MVQNTFMYLDSIVSNMIILVFHGQLGEVCHFQEKNGHNFIPACVGCECASDLQNKDKLFPFSDL